MQELIGRLEVKRDMWKADGKLSDRQTRGTYTISILVAKELLEKEKQQQGYTEEELFKIINDFCFDWNYNYKGELSQKQYLIEWFEKFKKK